MANKDMIGSLTSLRFFAAFAIVLHHSRGLVFPNEFMEGIPLASGVSFFFVLSGFILTYVYNNRMNSVGIYAFYTARFSRIWPAHIFTMLLVVLLFPPFEWTLGSHFGWLVALLNGTLLQAIVPVPSYYFSFNGVSWSISSEMFFYMVFPFLLVSLGRTWHVKLAGLFIAGGIVAYLFDRLGTNYYSSEKLTEFSGHGLAYISPVLRIQEFFIGMVLFKLYDLVKGWKVFGAAFCTLLEIAAIAAVVFWTQKVVGIPYALVGPGNKAAGEFWSHCATGLFFGLVVMVFALNGGLVSRVLSLRGFVVLGEISFALYMIHQIVFRFYSGHRPLLSALPSELVFPLLLVLAVGMAYGIWRLVEIPSQSALKKFFARCKTANTEVVTSV